MGVSQSVSQCAQPTPSVQTVGTLYTLHTTSPCSFSSSMIYDVDTQLTYLYQEEHSFSCEDWDDSGDYEEPGISDDDQEQDDDSLVGEETPSVEELEDIIEELNKEKSEILDGFS